MARLAKQKLSNPKRQIQGPLIQKEKKAPPIPAHNPININKAKPGATPPCSSYTLLKSTMENQKKSGYIVLNVFSVPSHSQHPAITMVSGSSHRYRPRFPVSGPRKCIIQTRRRFIKRINSSRSSPVGSLAQ